MRKVGLVMLVVLFGLGMIIQAAPVISVDAPIYEFGEILEGLAVVHTFVLQNAGDEPLEISDIEVSCGCTTTSLSKSTLAPGESVDLQVIFDSAGFSGKMVKKIEVKSNDPATSTLTLKLIGTVKRSERYHISVSDLNYLFYILVDLRSPEEYAESHLLGAINIPHDELPSWIDRLPRGVLVILYDTDSSTSDQAAQFLNDNGFPEARSLLGGLNEWARQFGERFIRYEEAE